ncbi:MAG: hypothetical protein J2P25_16105 [Nocardiopsaceae bacterium]|nr:hypothetical protein [Nocardiopsaceae bacterium]
MKRSTTLALVLSPVGVLLLAVVRLLIVSDYDENTALAIVHSGGYVNTLLGSVIPLVPILMPYLALLLLYLGQTVAALLALAATVLISPATVTGTAALSIARHDWDAIGGGDGRRHALLIILAAAFGLLLLAELAGSGLRVSARSVGTAAVVALVPPVVFLYPVTVGNSSTYTGLLTQPWLPAESITLATHRVVTGYVLDSDQDWTEVLLAGNRTVARYRTGQVVARAACQVAGAGQRRPLLPLIAARSRLPACVTAPPP